MTALAVGSYQLCWRALRETIRQPGVEVSNLFIPLFFFFVTVGAISNVAGPAFGVDNYEGFQLPVAVLQCVAGSASVSGIALIRDIESGYFDKLLLTPSPRLAIVLGRLFADAIRAIAFTAVILFVVSLVGAGMEAGPFGYAVILALAGLFGLAYSGIGATIALRTGNAQAAQAGFLLFFPLLFLSPAFAPKEVFDPWMEFLASINPVTYLLEGMRTLVLEGWQWDNLAGAVGAVLGLGVVTVALSLWALRARTR
ncbi:MAG: ABC transporter permease [Chloroflexi bacterium]|nr:ABC transporter permease [Chloroflexota bacterium]